MRIVVSVLCGLWLLSCGNAKQIDTSEIKDVMRNSKVKRVTEKEILQEVNDVGLGIEEKLNGDYRIECVDNLELNGFAVELFTTRYMEGGDDPASKKSQLLDAYKFGLANGQETGSNIQALNDTLYIYSFPLKKSSFIHTSCGSDLAFVNISKSVIVKSIHKK